MQGIFAKSKPTDLPAHLLAANALMSACAEQRVS